MENTCMTHMSSSLPESLVSKTQNILCIFHSHLLLWYCKVYSDIFNLLRLLLALLPKSVWNIAISVHFDFKTVLHLTPIYLYDTHEFKFAWKFSVKNSKCTMHIWLTSLTQIFSKFTQIFSIYSDYYWHYYQSLFEI